MYFGAVVAANILPPAVNCPRRPWPGSRGESTGNPVRISCSHYQPCRSCHLPSLVMELLREVVPLAPLSTTGDLSDSAADYALVPAEARLGHRSQPRLRSVLMSSLPTHDSSQVLDNAQDLLAAQHHLVEPAVELQHQVVPLVLSQLLHHLAQALPALLPRPRSLPGLLPVAPPRQHQVAQRDPAQPHLLPAGRLAHHPRAASAAAQPSAAQPLLHRQVVPRPRAQHAHSALQDNSRPAPPRDRARALPALPPTSLPASSLRPVDPAGPLSTPGSPARPVPPRLLACLCSVYPAAYLRSQTLFRSPLAPTNTSSSPHTVAFR